MTKSYSSLSALKNAIKREMRSALQETRDLTDADLIMNVNDYYSEGNPVKYVRTGTLLTSPETNEVSGSGDSLEFEAKMNEDIEYNTGTFDGLDVLTATEWGTHGVLGKPGYWDKTLEDIPKNIKTAFGKRFD